MIALRNVLVATDFSVEAEAALTYGRTLARTFGAALHLLHVADNIYLRLGTDGFIPPPELQTDLEEAVRKQLDALLIDNDPFPLRTHPAVVVSTSPALAITEYATKNNADLIVMGTHGHSALGNLVLGSVATGVLARCKVPVLLIP